MAEWEFLVYYLRLGLALVSPVQLIHPAVVGIGKKSTNYINLFKNNGCGFSARLPIERNHKLVVKLD